MIRSRPQASRENHVGNLLRAVASAAEIDPRSLFRDADANMRRPNQTPFPNKI
jgi:hypothetical protein